MTLTILDDDQARLDFENLIWCTFIIISIMNIIGDNDEKAFLNSNDSSYKQEANEIFELTLSVTLLIYLYFGIRNYDALQKADDDKKKLYEIKFLGSTLLIAGVICLLYFQKNQKNFIGSPA